MKKEGGNEQVTISEERGRGGFGEEEFSVGGVAGAMIALWNDFVEDEDGKEGGAKDEEEDEEEDGGAGVSVRVGGECVGMDV